MKRIATIVGLLGVLASLSFGYVLCGYDWTYKPSPMGEDWEINLDNCEIDPDSALAGVAAGPNTWNTEGSADFVFTYGGITTRSPDVSDGHNVVGFDNSSSQPYVAQTGIWYSGSNITEVDLVFNTYDYNWNGGTGSYCPPTRMDYWNVSAHEFGHWLCLDHSSYTTATMYAYVDLGETMKRTLHSDDIAGIQAIYGVCSDPPVADFSGSPTSGLAALNVDFTDLSTGGVSSWKWYFGDGDSSTVQHPSHTYIDTGSYDVTLTVTGPGGEDTEVKYDYITVSVNPDSAWLSLSPSGVPKLSSHSMHVGDSVDFSIILANHSDSAHSVLFPLYYDPDELDLVDITADTSSFPSPIAWHFFEKDTIYNDSGKVMIYAWTSAYAVGLPPGTHRVGILSLTASNIAETRIDTAFYPPEGHLYYTDGRDGVDYWPFWTPVDLSITIPNPDSAWLSVDPSGYPMLLDLDIHGSETVDLGMFLRNASDSAHSVMFPMWYDTSCLSLVSLDVDSSTYPFSDIGLWSFFENDTIVNDSGKVLLFAYTTTAVAGIPPGVNRVGTIDFQGIPPASDSSVCVLDTCFYPPAGHLYYTDAPSSVDYWPDWIHVDVVVYQGTCGDANGDGSVTTADGYHILNYFGAGPAPVSCWAANVNGDGNLTTGDGYHLLNWFGGGPALNCMPCE
jgi:PKD repeat protein